MKTSRGNIRIRSASSQWLRSLRIGLVLSCSLFSSALAAGHILAPFPWGMGAPLWPKGLLVSVDSPSGWKDRRIGKHTLTFNLSGDVVERPATEINVYVSGIAKPHSEIEGSDPMRSWSVSDLLSARKVTHVEKYATFNGAGNGRLPIWKIRSKAYDLFVILIVREHVVVDIDLRADDGEAKRYLDKLKFVARSVRFMK